MAQISELGDIGQPCLTTIVATFQKLRFQYQKPRFRTVYGSDFQGLFCRWTLVKTSYNTPIQPPVSNNLMCVLLIVSNGHCP